MHPLEVAGIVLAGGVFTSWCGWASVALIRIMAMGSSTTVTLHDHEERLNELEDLLPRHIPIPYS